MDLKRLDELGIKPLQGDLDRVAALTLPGNSVALGDPSGRLQIGYGSSPLVTVGVDTDARNSSAYVVTISAGQQWLEPDD
jgi:predicted metalloendopeptidase